MPPRVLSAISPPYRHTFPDHAARRNQRDLLALSSLNLTVCGGSARGGAANPLTTVRPCAYGGDSRQATSSKLGRGQVEVRPGRVRHPRLASR
jgi:hypothetical protein